MAGLKERMLKSLDESRKRCKARAEEHRKKAEKHRDEFWEKLKGSEEWQAEKARRKQEYDSKIHKINEKYERNMAEIKRKSDEEFRKLALKNRDELERMVKSGELCEVPGVSPQDRNFKYCVKKGLSAGKDSIICGGVLFVGAFVILIIPLLNLLSLPMMVIGLGCIFYGLCVTPFATFLYERGQAFWARVKVVVEEERKKEAEEKGVEYLTLEEEIRVRNKMLKEDAQRRKEVMEKQLAEQTERMREEKPSPQEPEEEKKVPDTFTNMKVDMGDGKKVKFDDLPKHLQEQLLEEYSKEEQSE